MKLFVASDIHGSLFYTKKMIEAFQNEGADRLILLGDLLYHGPRNPLTKEYNPAEVATILNGYADKILAVRGNCDSEVDQMILNFPIMADYALLPIMNTTVFMTHGHLFNLENPPKINKGDILLHGHTHIPIITKTDSFTYINPGSISLPKEDSQHGYMIIEGDKFIWKNLDGVPYQEMSLSAEI